MNPKNFEKALGHWIIHHNVTTLDIWNCHPNISFAFIFRFLKHFPNLKKVYWLGKPLPAKTQELVQSDLVLTKLLGKQPPTKGL